MTRIVYLHGFASGPGSSKATYFRRRFAESGVEFHVPQLDRGDFQSLTLTSQIGVIEQAVAGRPAILMGSSLGGYLAAWYASRHPEIERVVLMAPAFQFRTRWRQRFSEAELEEWKRTGWKAFFHYARGELRPLGYQFCEDADQCEDEPHFSQPALILHGTADTVVPAELSRCYAARHPNVTLRLYESGHELSDVLDPMWEEVRRFLDNTG